MKALILTLGEVISATGLTFENDVSTHLDSPITAPWNNRQALPSQITYLESPDHTVAKFTICSDPEVVTGVPTIGLIHPHPRYAMAKVAELWHEDPSPWEFRGRNGVTAYRHVEISDSAKIWPGTVLGADGFGFVWDPYKKRYLKFPHLGRVIIGHHVEIQSNCNVDRGALSNTTIGRGTKIDSMVHIAHNCQIGQDVMIAACAELSGSVRVHDRVWIGPNVSIMQGVTIGADATIGIGAVVLRDVNPGQTVVGHHRIIDSKRDQLGVIR